MERLEGELTRTRKTRKVKIFTDICHRMKERPFSLQSGRGRGHEGFESSFAPRSVPSQPEQSRFKNSKIKSVALHPNITSLTPDAPDGNDVLYHSNSPPKILQAGETGRGSSYASSTSPLRKSTREPSAAKQDSVNVPGFRRKEKTNVLLHTSTAPFPSSSPPGKSNSLTQQPLLKLKGPKSFPLSFPSSKPGVTRSERLEHFSFPSQDQGKGRAPTLHQLGDNRLDVSYHDDVRIDVALRPFPMNSREIKTALHPCVHSSSQSLGSKRGSDHNDGGYGRKVKRRMEDNSKNLTKVILGDNSDEDSFEIDRTVDPSILCPYCDDPLPLNPMPQLNDLLATAKQQSYADPRPQNPFGLKAPLGIYISACQRHHFETYSLPEAMEKGWPQSIDFKEVPKRVESMKSALQDIITDADNCSDNEDSEIHGDTRGPRARCIFWRELKKEIKKQGSRTITGVKGQFFAFEKTQPGYYGELGLLIINQTLYDLFPFSSFDTSLIVPLSPAEFVQLVLVPEVAVRLIMQDLHLDRDKAIITLRESSQYGVGMFPDIGSATSVDDNDDDNYESVADRIAMERAKARRLELEKEEKIEEKMWKEEQAECGFIAQVERDTTCHRA